MTASTIPNSGRALRPDLFAAFLYVGAQKRPVARPPFPTRGVLAELAALQLVR